MDPWRWKAILLLLIFVNVEWSLAQVSGSSSGPPPATPPAAAPPSPPTDPPTTTQPSATTAPVTKATTTAPTKTNAPMTDGSSNTKNPVTTTPTTTIIPVFTFTPNITPLPKRTLGTTAPDGQTVAPTASSKSNSKNSSVESITSLPKWVLPAAIGGGVAIFIILIICIILCVRRKSRYEGYPPYHPTETGYAYAGNQDEEYVVPQYNNSAATSGSNYPLVNQSKAGYYGRGSRGQKPNNIVDRLETMQSQMSSRDRKSRPIQVGQPQRLSSEDDAGRITSPISLNTAINRFQHE